MLSSELPTDTNDFLGGKIPLEGNNSFEGLPHLSLQIHVMDLFWIRSRLDLAMLDTVKTE